MRFNEACVHIKGALHLWAYIFIATSVTVNRYGRDTEYKWFEPVQVSIFITMNHTKPEQAVQSGSVQSSAVHWFTVRFAGSEPNLANTMWKDAGTPAWWCV